MQNHESALLTEERRREILALLARQGGVRSAALSAGLGVSEDTIRRDLRELAEAGLLQRVHGGALPRTPTSPRFDVRERESPAAKQAIAGAAAALVRPGQVVIMDAGTTTLEVARRLDPELRVTVVTNSPPICVALAAHRFAEVHVIGGRLYREGVAVVGAPAVDALRDVHADLCLLGVAGLHPEAGITVLDLEEAYVKRAMMEGAADVVAVAAGDKLDTAVSYRVGPISALTHLVTDREVTESRLAPYRAAGITVVQA
jgi:DeoR/GlpR family transcriptional regulator of sugar metabolism